MHFRKAVLTALALLPPALGATEYVKETTLTVVASQATRPIQPSTDNADFVNFASGPTWTMNGGGGGSACSEIAAVIPSNNVMMRSIAHAAIASGATVIVTVDNSLPGAGAYCVITTLQIKSH